MKKSSIIVVCTLVLSVICFSGFSAEAEVIVLKKGQTIEIGDGLIPVTMTYEGLFNNASYQLKFNKSSLSLTEDVIGTKIETTAEGNTPSKIKLVVFKYNDTRIFLEIISCKPIMCYIPGEKIRSMRRVNK